MIKIRVVTYNNEPPPQPQEAVFGHNGASIGRDKDNFFVLPDPKRYVSRTQASVKSDGQRHTIVNLSQANPILVNGDEVNMGMETPLQPGDDIQIGLYLLRAESADVGAEVAGAIEAPALAPAAPARPAASPEAAVLDIGAISGGGADPFADLLGTPAPSPSQARSPAPAPTQPPASWTASSPAAIPANPFGFDDLLAAPIQNQPLPDKPASIIPDDFDPFALPSAEHRNSIDPLAHIAANDVSLESISGNNASIDSLLIRDRADGPSQLDPASLEHTSSETDPLRLFGGDSLLPSNGHEQDFSQLGLDRTPEINGYFAMPQMVPDAHPSSPLSHAAAPALIEVPAAPVIEDKTPPQTAAPAPHVQLVQPVIQPEANPPNVPKAASAPAGGGLDPQDLAQAFLRGAGLPADTIPNGVSLEWMEMIGAFVATATQGAVDLIASRALVKREVKADVTMIVVRNNNPLKFLPDAESALIQMLGKKIPGFMEPNDAMQDAYLDLRAHQIGVFAGMRAALAEVLKRFDPVQLENKLKRKTVMDSLMASNRKGKLWDLYGELFKEIYIEAQDDFQTLFGKAFVEAYETEIERFSKDATSASRHD